MASRSPRSAAGPHVGHHALRGFLHKIETQVRQGPAIWVLDRWHSHRCGAGEMRQADPPLPICRTPKAVSKLDKALSTNPGLRCARVSTSNVLPQDQETYVFRGKAAPASKERASAGASSHGCGPSEANRYSESHAQGIPDEARRPRVHSARGVAAIDIDNRPHRDCRSASLSPRKVFAARSPTKGAIAAHNPRRSDPPSLAVLQFN